METIKKNLLEIKEGKEAVVVEMLAESRMRARLDNMGITVGTKLTKVSDSFLHGPVTVKFGNSWTALGYGMAEKIILEENVIEILLIGNPNGGKSMLFNRLTGASVLAANYPGSTVEYTTGRVTIAGGEAEVIDVPSTYSLKPTSTTEEVAVRMLAEGKPVIVNVIDSTNLERSLNLTLQLLKTRRPMLVVLNLWDETKHTGINIDVEKLEKTLGVPCIPTTAITGEGIKDLVEKIPHARISSYDFEDAERWHEVGNIVEAVQTITHKHHTFLEWLGDRSVMPISAIPIALMVLAAMFWAIWQIGEGLSSYLFEPLLDGIPARSYCRQFQPGQYRH
ncbi:MAG: FeoB small GTPase domain-containing protein [Planctomycetota bacterium]|jgi:ferrous iron transport protein B